MKDIIEEVKQTLDEMPLCVQCGEPCARGTGGHLDCLIAYEQYWQEREREYRYRAQCRAYWKEWRCLLCGKHAVEGEEITNYGDPEDVGAHVKCVEALEVAE